MGVYYETIPKNLEPWILSQKMLWVATAPLAKDGHINVSPKGGQYFGIVGQKRFWFMDLTGSGVETTSHLHEPGNGRICIMFQAFEGPPRIVRLWGRGRVLERFGGEFEGFVQSHGVGVIKGARSIIIVDIDQVATSCGFSVPFYDFKGFRKTLNEVFEKREKTGQEVETMDAYWAYKSQLSVDGLPGMKRGYDYAQKYNVEPLKKFIGDAAPKVPRRSDDVGPVHLLLAALLGLVIGAVLAVSMVDPELVRKIQRKEIWGV